MRWGIVDRDGWFASRFYDSRAEARADMPRLQRKFPRSQWSVRPARAIKGLAEPIKRDEAIDGALILAAIATVALLAWTVLP